MKGFQDTFSDLYNKGGGLRNGSINASGYPSDNSTQTCSSGNGAGSDSIIVREQYINGS